MNANELADEAQKQSGLIYLVTEKQVAQQLEQMLKNYATMLRQQQAENKKLKDFVKPILASGDECVGDWVGDELQDLAVKTGLYIEKVMTEPCNKDKEEFVACPCREYHYDDESWVCYRIEEFLLEDKE